MNKIPLSVAIITKDEAANLPNCLKSLYFAAQIVVVDSGSTDDTVKIASDFGCNVFVESWRGGFGAQKQLAIDQCLQPWILVLDADELIPPETASKIKQIISNTDYQNGRLQFPAEKFFPGAMDPACWVVAGPNHQTFSKESRSHDSSHSSRGHRSEGIYRGTGRSDRTFYGKQAQQYSPENRSLFYPWGRRGFQGW